MKRTFGQIVKWFDSYAVNYPNLTEGQSTTTSVVASQDIESAQDSTSSEKDLNWVRITPFILLHLACFSVIWVGWSPIAVGVAIAFYFVRMIGITAFYHRYFSHRTFKTSRALQFIFALVGAAATQRGPLWWASHHRHHHYHSDTDDDVHSPNQGLIWSHMGWFLSDQHFVTRHDLIKDFARFKELVFLDRFDLLVPIACAVGMYLLGTLLAAIAPSLGTSGLQMLVWGYVISTIALIHATLCINSMAHRLGNKRFPTSDSSRNNFFLALLTCGEGWHNNHHRFPFSARQGIRWWEIDVSYYIIKVMEKLGLVWNVRPGPTKEQIARALATPVPPRIPAQHV